MTTIIWAERVLSVNSERLIMQMADRLAEDGYRDAGYTYVSIDVSLQKLMNVGFSTVLVPPKGDSFLNFQTFTIFLCIMFLYSRIAGLIRSETLLVIFSPTAQDFQME